jgi:hypothetical protein
MKFELVALLSFMAVQNGQANTLRFLQSTQCQDCFEQIDDAQDCLRECNDVSYLNTDTGLLDGTVLNECLDPDRDDRNDIFGKKQKPVEDIKDLSECCKDGIEARGEKWDNDCEKTFEEVAACLQANCFSSCLVTDAQNWFDCIQDKTDDVTGDKKCSRQSCINGLFEEEEDDAPFGDGNSIDATVQEDLEDTAEFIEIGNSKDSIFDVDNVASLFEEIAGEVSDCTVLEPFTESVCRVGDTCCEECNTEMATVLNCLVNQVVAPFVAIAANITGPLICPIPENCEVDKKKRFLNAMEGRDENAMVDIPASVDYSLAMPKMVQKFEDRRRLQNTTEADDAQYCVDQMEMNIIAHNMTYAANKFMECTASAGLARLQDPAAETDSGSSAFSMLAMVAMAALSTLAIYL